ncbi:hypothetical protein DFQ28_009601 [Apophysomyces sp. BC1034]|nr:hypothetical protein DFQ30_006557 [Apophysomyces sp. BC1015]KAG0181038.1 hypothetical protein DFQ29_009505 [Apophysomyces sp. BC1021]KAG0192280.1 hypothetical protein DFQ28_009601 [Apophysomyces sp. BC1034]
MNFPDSSPRLLSHNTVQEQWDVTKEAVSRVIKHYNHGYVPWCQAQLRLLQTKRNRTQRSRPTAAVLAQLLPTVEKQISVLQTELTDIAALRAGQRWRELGNRSAGYLKRIIAARAAARQMPTLQHPHTGNLCHSPSEMQQAANLFYQELYTPDPVNEGAIADLLVSLPSSTRLSIEEREELTTEFHG